jgi:plastocyanin
MREKDFPLHLPPDLLGITCSGRLYMKTPKEGTFKPSRYVNVLLLAVAGAVLGFCAAAKAAEFTVEMTAYYHFSPSYLEIQVNDIVTWVNHDWSDYHSTVSTDGYWDSGDLDYNETYSLQFLAVGTYGYEDYYYWVLGMTGTIVVQPATPTQPTPATLIDLLRLQDGRFQFSLSNLTVLGTYVIQGSSNLVNWTNLATNVAASTVETWTDNAAATAARRYYRSYQIP